MRLERPRDWRFPAALSVVLVIEALAMKGVGADGLVAVPIAFALCMPLAWHRQAPVFASLAPIVVLVVDEHVGVRLTDGAVVFAAVVASILTAGAFVDERRQRVVAPLLLVLVNVGAITSSGDWFGNFVFGTFVVFLPPFLAGLAYRSRTRLVRRLREQALALEAEREARAERAALEERTRVADELHDLVAQGVTAMLAQVADARRLVVDDPERAPEAIAGVEERGREALTEMRRLLGVLRRGDEDLALAPQPSLARLDALVERLAAAGVAVAVRVEGEPQPVTPGLDVAAYRIVEETLAAVAGAGEAEVALRWRDDALVLEVATPQPALADAPLATARERAALFGGELQSGRRPRGGSAVRVTLPATDRASRAPAPVSTPAEARA